MTATVLIAHPYKKSFNHALFERVCNTLRMNNITLYAHDLHEENFDPVITVDELGKAETRDPLVKKYARELIDSDILIFIHPNWWGQPPAIMKGYIDRVIRPPYAYYFSENDSGGGIPEGGLTGKGAIVFNTSNTEASRENNFFGDPLENIWKQCVFAFCGIPQSTRRIFRIVADSTEAQRKGWLDEAEHIVLSEIERRREA